ncbi:hypothetical protein E2C01_039565 [Portunus trituberculatus]|uniref:Uncharacterized protein n=1 Tax=Portunus trituberculatus TaxID=210409 RepID=A0A5B7FL36_PORTR|nr:hypothetical protein [Portunus trituberculatus]
MYVIEILTGRQGGNAEPERMQGGRRYVAIVHHNSNTIPRKKKKKLSEILRRWREAAEIRPQHDLGDSNDLTETRNGE